MKRLRPHRPPSHELPQKGDCGDAGATSPIAVMTQPTSGARYEITVDGKPRSNRDTKTKSKNPNVEVTVRDLIGGETIVIKNSPLK